MSVFKFPGKHSRLWKEWRAIGRGRHERFFLEHSEAVLEALESTMPPVQILLSSARYREEQATWDRLACQHSIGWFLLEQEALDKLISVPSCSGLCGVFAPQSQWRVEDLDASFVLLGWEVQDPGNVGTLIRSCAALTGGAVLLVGGCKPWSAKVARSSAGALLRTPVLSVSAHEGESTLRTLIKTGYKVFSTVPRGGVSLSEVEWSGRDVVLVGNETRGVPPEIQKFTSPVTIGMDSGAESLNVAVAGSITCYEWGQRSRVHG